MRKLSYILLVLTLVVPLAIPFSAALAQDGTGVVAALEAYVANLPAGYGNVTVDVLIDEIYENPD
ncbi:MAG: hypothetical protein GYB65_23435, partial [Chloroflexi bacterium]|nr:hypothetical protein [Chloroflexota bacterium]